MTVPGLLFLFYTCVNMIFWRVFMRISYSCPAHLKFSLTVEKWTGLVKMSGDAIDWLDAHETMYDVWLLVAYCATSCALIQVRFSLMSCFVAKTLIYTMSGCSITPTHGGRIQRHK